MCLKVVKMIQRGSFALTKVQNVTILHPCPRDTGKVAALGPNIMSPKGCKLLPEGRRPAGSRPEPDQGRGPGCDPHQGGNLGKSMPGSCSETFPSYGPSI